jgi:hypothetical protein
MRRLTLTTFLGSALSGTLCLAALVSADAPASAQATGPVSAQPASGTPQLDQTGNTTEIVRQLAQCGSTMYAVGSFTRIEWNGTVYDRSNIFSFSATAPYMMTSWAPSVNGIVNSITFNGSDCADAYIGGAFSSVNSTKVSDIAEIDTAVGNVVSTFGHDANSEVETLLAVSGRILVGGQYTSINGSTADPYMTGLNPATGADDGYVHLSISGSYQFPGAGPNPTQAYNQQLSHGGTLDLVEGDFTKVGGQPRQQVFMLSLGATNATVTGWAVPDFDQHCVTEHPFYAHSGAWASNDSMVYVATTGYHPLTAGHVAGGLCDAAMAFPATQTSVSPAWVNYTGCWSLFSVTADSAAVYVGGHEEYQNNPDGCKSAGPGAVPDPGLGGLSPATGKVLLNSKGTAGLYERSRGEGADDLLLTSAGLWVASDNGVYSHGTFHLSDVCGFAHGHAGICFLPYAA